ncbi:hypothetical protein GOP47_0008000 [Adiantum capillus-veneris]|uniref:Reverse transcriptase domain-containing protein n=1 Tax=Adiantum capillus-veneris TaxID=13818 RepID=A0A9D4ZM14_ADICA|nr:hypothetical protein GOP47_0008000 [Adiantum capillus-veneris]
MEQNNYRARQEKVYDRKRPNNTTPHVAKNTEGNTQKKSKYLTRAEIDQYKAAGKCFSCGESGHLKANCPQNKTQKTSTAPSLNSILDVQANTQENPQVRQFMKEWRIINNQRVLILFDLGSTDNFMSLDTAEGLRVTPDRLGTPIGFGSAFEGSKATSTPIQGKFNLRMGEYKDEASFLLAPISACDIILGMPWHYHLSPIPDYKKKTMTFQFKGQSIILTADAGDWPVPIVSHVSIQKEIKNFVSAYMIFANECEVSITFNQVSDSSSDHVSFLSQYEDCFTNKRSGVLPPQRPEDHTIDLIPGNSPPNKPPYRVSASQQTKIFQKVNDLLEKGLIRPSSSPYCSLVLLVQKKDGSFRMCIDYCSLNKITVKHRFPIPRIDDILDKLQGESIFSRIDLKSGYDQIRIVPEDIHKTAFRTTFGLYEFLVMPFGLANSLATFNRMMDRIFRPNNQFTGVFFDDILVFSKTEAEHKAHLDTVFKELRANSLQIKKKKSEFFLSEIKYLGHIVSHNLVRMDPDKVKAIVEWPEPKSVHEVRSFL